MADRFRSGEDYWLSIEFDVAIRIPLTLFHGGQDRNYPLALVERVANSLPGAQLLSYPEEGHISIFPNHSDEIVKTLIPDKQGMPLLSRNLYGPRFTDV